MNYAFLHFIIISIEKTGFVFYNKINLKQEIFIL